MESSMSRLENHRSPTLSSFEGRELSLHVYRPLLTKLEEQYRKVCGKNLVGGQKNGAHSAAGCVRCKFQHREGSKPVMN
jgi:hypothetical protein